MLLPQKSGPLCQLIVMGEYSWPPACGQCPESAHELPIGSLVACGISTTDDWHNKAMQPTGEDASG